MFVLVTQVVSVPRLVKKFTSKICECKESGAFVFWKERNGHLSSAESETNQQEGNSTFWSGINGAERSDSLDS